MPYFIFRHSESSSYKDKIGKVYHFTEKSPNWRKVEVNSKILIYEKKLDAFIGIGRIKRIEKKKVGKILHFFAHYTFKKFKFPVFSVDFVPKLKRKLNGKLPGIIPISKRKFETLLKLAEI